MKAVYVTKVMYVSNNHKQYSESFCCIDPINSGFHICLWGKFSVDFQLIKIAFLSAPAVWLTCPCSPLRGEQRQSQRGPAIAVERACWLGNCAVLLHSCPGSHELSIIENRGHTDFCFFHSRRNFSGSKRDHTFQTEMTCCYLLLRPLNPEKFFSIARPKHRHCIGFHQYSNAKRGHAFQRLQSHVRR